MKKAELDKLTEQAGVHFNSLMRESQDKLEAAIEGVIEESAFQETTPTLRIGFSIAVDLDKRKAEFTLVFGVRHKITSEDELADPDQIQLPIDGLSA